MLSKKRIFCFQILSKSNFFFTFASVFIRFIKKYEQIGTFRFEIDSFRNPSFIRFDSLFGLRKKCFVSFWFYKENIVFLCKRFYSSFYHYFYILNVFAWFRYRSLSIEHFCFSRWDAGLEECRTGGP